MTTASTKPAMTNLVPTPAVCRVSGGDGRTSGFRSSSLPCGPSCRRPGDFHHRRIVSLRPPSGRTLPDAALALVYQAAGRPTEALPLIERVVAGTELALDGKGQGTGDAPDAVRDQAAKETSGSGAAAGREEGRRRYGRGGPV
jgi:hypothetical protein